MRNGRTGKMGCQALAALAFAVALAHGNPAAAANISTAVASSHSAQPNDDAAPGGPLVRDEFADRHTSASDHQPVLTQPLTSACKTEGCPRRAVVASDTIGLAINGTRRFQTLITWQSGFSIAGSRAWTKVIKFSSNGINIRLPLN
jgi:hypothetical protein